MKVRKTEIAKPDPGIFLDFRKRKRIYFAGSVIIKKRTMKIVDLDKNYENPYLVCIEEWNEEI
jgi:hypothetical protein